MRVGTPARGILRAIREGDIERAGMAAGWRNKQKTGCAPAVRTMSLVAKGRRCKIVAFKDHYYSFVDRSHGAYVFAKDGASQATPS